MSATQDEFNGMAKESLGMLTAFLKPLLDFAKEQVEKHHGFAPFGAYLDSRNKMILSMMGEAEEPEGTKQLARLATCVRGRVTEVGSAAAVLCYDCRVVPPGQVTKSDAVCIHFEDKLGERWDVFFPYLVADNGGVQYQPWHYEHGQTLIY